MTLLSVFYPLCGSLVCSGDHVILYAVFTLPKEISVLFLYSEEEEDVAVSASSCVSERDAWIEELGLEFLLLFAIVKIMSSGNYITGKRSFSALPGHCLTTRESTLVGCHARIMINLHACSPSLS